MPTTRARSAAVGVDDLTVLLPDWRTHLRPRNVAASTITSYLTVGTNLLAWLTEQGMQTTAGGIARDHLEAFLAALVDRVAPATVAKHYRSMQQLFRWLVEDGEMPHSPMDRMRPPAVPEQPVEVFTDDELRALLDAAKGNTFENRRDTALLRMLIDTGVRARLGDSPACGWTSGSETGRTGHRCRRRCAARSPRRDRQGRPPPSPRSACRRTPGKPPRSPP